MMKEYKIERWSIADVFGKGHTYMVPIYQRPYAWPKDYAERLFDNLVEMASNDEVSITSNLLGAMVVVDGEKGVGYEVVDGQQRLATLSLIFCAMRTRLQKFAGTLNGTGPSLEDAINKLDNLVKIKGKNAKNVKIRVEMGGSDSQLFQEIVNNENPDHEEFCKYLKKKNESMKKRMEKSHTLMIDNYEKLCEKTEEWMKKFKFDKFKSDGDADGFSRAVISLKSEVDSMAKCNNFAFIVAPDKHLAHKIFNTLNSLRKKLNQADLIKSHLLSKAEDEPSVQKMIESNWPKIFDRDLGEPDKFLYESISSRNPSGKSGGIKVTEENLYRIIEWQVKSANDVQKCLDDFSEDAKFLKLMNHPEDLHPDPKYDKIRSDFYGIRALNARYIRVPILAAHRIWKDVNKREFQELVDCLLIFFFKFKFINDGTAEDVRSIANKVTRHLEAKRPISEIIYHILVNEDVPGQPPKRISDDAFKINFKNKMYKMPPGTAKYVLASIEMLLRQRDNKETMRYIDYNFEVEHILPKRHKKPYWDAEKFLGDENYEDIDKYKDRLGNLTILSAKWNRGLAAKEFLMKRDDKDGYKHSDFKINNYLKNCTEWTAVTLSEREESLAKIAVDTWSLAKYDKYLKECGYEA